jgi:hypothetical protein
VSGPLSGPDHCHATPNDVHFRSEPVDTASSEVSMKGDIMPKPKDAKDGGERPEPEPRASRPRRRGEPSRESVQDRDRDMENDDDGGRAVHLDFEQGRFAGGLAPTPELYALAREQWYRLAGAVVRPSMDPVVGDSASGKAQLPDQPHPDGKGAER